MADRNEIKKLVREVLEGSQSPTSSKPVVEHVKVNSIRKDVEKAWDLDESSKALLTETDLKGLGFRSKVRVAPNVQLTPLAKDLVSDLELTLVPKETRTKGLKVRSVAIGCDHGGFETKEALKSYLTGLGVKVRDFGTDSKDSVDYPDFAHAVARAVAENTVEAGIVIDGAGIGSAMTANKVPGIHAAACYSPALAKNSREHNGANVLTLGSGQNNLDEIKEITKAFLSTEISEPRHKKRVGKIDAI
ncbi:MAG: ribose 5-phosphate isomerase B, partial [Pyrinomonadaceae bacterium]|nr:ribose 5-phosphate isomerase B [Pyrinomonadaceae bacterium]